MNSISGGLGQLSYSSFYLPTLTFGYFSTQPNSALLQLFPHFSFHGLVLEPIYIFYFLTAFTFLGAMQKHGIVRAIYGPDGPSARPKHKSLNVKYGLAIVLNELPEQIPVVLCDIADRGFIPEFLDYITYQHNKAQLSGAMDSNDKRQLKKKLGPIPPRHRLETGFEQLLDFKKHLNWRKVPRIAYFIPMLVLKLVSYFSLLGLVAYIVLGTVSYAVFLLTLGHIVLLFRSLFWAPIPNYVNAEALDDRFVPEYRILEQDNRK